MDPAKPNQKAPGSFWGRTRLGALSSNQCTTSTNTIHIHPGNHQHEIMAADALPPPALNDTRDEGAIQLAIDLPHSPGTRINLHLTVLAKSILLFLTSTSPDAGQQAAAMGSFVYAMPDVSNVHGLHRVKTDPHTTEIQSDSAYEYGTLQRAVHSGLCNSHGQGPCPSTAKAMLCQQQH